MSAPKVGVFLPTMTPKGVPLGDVVAAGRHAEALGFDAAWVVDQLVAGTGRPVLDSTLVLAAVSAATERIELALGVLIVPLRPVAWIAKQVATLQHLSSDRLILGVGIGGDGHDRSWAAAGVPRRERGARTDAALEVLPDLVAGRVTEIVDPAGGHERPAVQLAPGADMPPLAVGGMSDAALRRVVRYGASWFLLPVPAPDVEASVARLDAAWHEAGHPTEQRPPVIGSVMAAIEGDPALPDAAGVRRAVTDPDGLFGMPDEAVDTFLVAGPPEVIADRLRSLQRAGADRVVVTLVAGDWFRQADLLAEAVALV